jgi:hypothetical protein
VVSCIRNIRLLFIFLADETRLAMVACRQVLVRKQTGYGEVIAWLEEETRKLSGQKGLDVGGLVAIAKKHRW